AEGDGISASNYLQIMKGSFNIVTGGGYENGQKQTSDNWGQPGGQMGGGHMGGGMRPGPRTAEPTAATVTETTTDDASDSIKGLKAGGSLLIADGSFTINSADDAIHSNLSVTIKGGAFNIKTGDDGVHSDETLAVSGGSITITQSYEGLEGLHIAVSGGSVTLTARDDGLNAAGGTDQSGFGGDRGGDMFGGKGGMSSGNGSIVISGGTLNITASGDGIDANGTLEIKGGTTTVTGPTQGDTATLDYDRSATISGGTFIGTGAQGMAQTFSESSQGVISVSVGNGAASTKITLKDKKGNVIIDHTPSLNYAIVILSSPNIKSGETYSLTVGSYTADVTAN
ncbi:MAG: carbohydrate-binding domain-containing protein, partial [Clostridia bacterium]|nr:carbohydrate-binding domain-containing protein [Clostridia bacterium]